MSNGFFDMLEDLDVQGNAMSRTRASGYYSGPEALMVLECTGKHCSFVWDFLYVADLQDTAPDGLVYEPMSPGDEYCPRCGNVGEGFLPLRQNMEGS